MKEFPTIVAMLKTSFNAEDGLSEDVSICLYWKMPSSSGKLKALKEELEMAFSSKEVSWKKILFNDDYEVFLQKLKMKLAIMLEEFFGIQFLMNSCN